MSGTADIYYGLKEYHKHRNQWLQHNDEEAMKRMDSHFDRLPYVIYKEEPNGETPPYTILGERIPTEIILLGDDGLVLDWDTEIEKGLDQIYVQHS